MSQQKKEPKTSRKRIADEILRQIGKSVIIVFVIVAVAALCMVGWLVITSKQTELTLQSQAAANQLTGFLEGYIKEVEDISVNPEIIHVMTETKAGDDILKAEKMDTVRENLLSIANTDPENLLSVWIADIDASVLTQSDGFTTADGWDVTTREWYKCVGTKETILTEPYIDSASGKMILSAVSPVMDSSGTVIGAAGMDISLEQMTNVMSTYKIGSGGYVLLLSESGTFLYHPQSEIIQQNIADINISQNVKDAVLSGQEDFLRYTANGIPKYGAVKAAGDTGYIILSNMPLLEYYSLLIGMIIALVLLFVVGIILIAFSIKKSAQNLTKPILELNHIAQQLAAGDLNVHLHIESEDEIGELGESIGKTVSRLKEYIVYIDETAEVLAQIANGKLSIELKNDYVGEFQKIKDALINISDSMNEVMFGISETSERVSAGAAELASASQMIAEGAELQAASVQQIAATTNTVADHVEKSHQDAEESASATHQVASMIEQNQEKMTLMMNAMEEIRQTSQQVVGIIETIEEIAEQTNLLSLNASIEAARAGEAGKGFAVVADEIGKLANSSSEIAEKIQQVSSEVISAVDDLSKEAEKMVSFINNTAMSGYQSLVDTGDNYKSDAGSFYDMMDEFLRTASDLRENMDSIKEAIEAINIAVEESAKGVNNVSEKAVNLTEIVNSINTDAQGNQTVASDLNNEVGKFKI